MKLKELLAGLDILSSSADLNTDIHEVQYDSRLVEPGDLFIARRETSPSCRWPTPAGRWRWWAATALTIPPES